jgi:hypothetical protein
MRTFSASDLVYHLEIVNDSLPVSFDVNLPATLCTNSHVSLVMRRTPSNSGTTGDDAVILGWEDEIHLVGPNGVASK